MNARGDVGGKINAAGVLTYEAAYEAFGDIETEARLYRRPTESQYQRTRSTWVD